MSRIRIISMFTVIIVGALSLIICEYTIPDNNYNVKETLYIDHGLRINEGDTISLGGRLLVATAWRNFNIAQEDKDERMKMLLDGRLLWLEVGAKIFIEKKYFNEDVDVRYRGETYYTHGALIK